MNKENSGIKPVIEISNIILKLMCKEIKIISALPCKLAQRLNNSRVQLFMSTRNTSVLQLMNCTRNPSFTMSNCLEQFRPMSKTKINSYGSEREMRVNFKVIFFTQTEWNTYATVGWPVWKYQRRSVHNNCRVAIVIARTFSVCHWPQDHQVCRDQSCLISRPRY